MALPKIPRSVQILLPPLLSPRAHRRFRPNVLPSAVEVFGAPTVPLPIRLSSLRRLSSFITPIPEKEFSLRKIPCFYPSMCIKPSKGVRSDGTN